MTGSPATRVVPDLGVLPPDAILYLLSRPLLDLASDSLVRGGAGEACHIDADLGVTCATLLTPGIVIRSSALCRIASKAGRRSGHGLAGNPRLPARP
jgi:hypothetical protein